MSLPRLRSVLIATALAVTAAVLPLTPASAAPTLSVAVTGGGAPGDPTLISTGPEEQTINLAIGLSASSPNVTVTAGGEGLILTQPTLTFGGQAPGSFPAQLKVRASTAGFHTLTVTVTSDGATPAVLTLDRLWAPGDTHLTATGSLAGQTWAAQVTNGSRFPEGNMIWFLDGDTAAIGNTRGGRPTCDQTPTWLDDGPCVPYAYDPATGLIELGRSIGLVRPDSIHLAGVTGDGYFGSFDLSGRADFTFQLAPLRAGRRLAATFTLVNRIPRPTKRASTLTLRKNGTFDFSSYYGARRRGTYAIKANGRFVLKVKGRFGTKVETFLAVAGPGGPNLKKYGAWLTGYEDGRTGYPTSKLLAVRR